jgi:hypothetical protein
MNRTPGAAESRGQPGAIGPKPRQPYTPGPQQTRHGERGPGRQASRAGWHPAAPGNDPGLPARRGNERRDDGPGKPRAAPYTRGPSMAAPPATAAGVDAPSRPAPSATSDAAGGGGSIPPALSAHAAPAPVRPPTGDHAQPGPHRWAMHHHRPSPPPPPPRGPAASPGTRSTRGGVRIRTPAERLTHDAAEGCGRWTPGPDARRWHPPRGQPASRDRRP